MEELKGISNWAAVLHGPLDIRVEPWPMPSPLSADEVLIRVECVGLCGSDVKFFTSGKCGFEVLKDPMVMGHEGSGVVIQVGSKVSSLRVGDRVAIEPTQPCRKCDYCKLGRYNLCPEPFYCSTPNAAGNLCKYYKHVADFCHKVPDNLSLEEAAAVQPLAIAIHACRRAKITLGASVAVLGGGPIGVLCAMTARAMGASNILVTDVVQTRLDTAKQLGADHVLLTQGMTEEESVDKIIQLIGRMPDVTIDACAFPSVQRVAMKVTRSGGTLLIVVISTGNVEVPLSPTVLREVDIIGSYRFSNSYPAALAAVATGAISLKKFITHHFPLNKTEEGLEVARSGAGMKVIIHVQK